MKVLRFGCPDSAFNFQHGTTALKDHTIANEKKTSYRYTRDLNMKHGNEEMNNLIWCPEFPNQHTIKQNKRDQFKISKVTRTVDRYLCFRLSITLFQCYSSVLGSVTFRHGFSVQKPVF